MFGQSLDLVSISLILLVNSAFFRASIRLFVAEVPHVFMTFYHFPQIFVVISEITHGWPISQENSYDVIIVDSSDPVGPAEKLWLWRDGTGRDWMSYSFKRELRNSSNSI